MALSAPSNLSLDINVVQSGITQATQELANLQRKLSEVEKQNNVTQSRMKERSQSVRDLSYETKQLVVQRQQLLQQAKLSDSPSEVAALNRQATAIQNVVLANKSSILTQKERLEISKQNNIAQNKEMSLLNGQIATTEKHISALQKQQSAIQQGTVSTNMFSQAWNKFSMIFTRVMDALIAFKLIQWGSQVLELFTTHVIDVNEQFEKLKVRLYTLNPDLEQTARIWNEIKSVTVTSPFRIAEVAQAAVMLRTFGVSAVQNLRSVADWASAVEKDLNDVSIAFGKIVNRSPRTALMLSTRGLSMGGYEQYISEYKDRAIALQRYIDDTFGGTAARISETFYGLKTNIADLFDIMIQGKGEPVFKELKRDLQYIQTILTDINEQMGNSGIAGWLASKIIPTGLLQSMSEDRLLKEFKDLQTEDLAGKNSKYVLANLERQRMVVTLLEEGYVGLIRNGKEWSVSTADALSILDKHIKRQRELVALTNQELMLKNSNYSLLERYEAQQEMKEASPRLMNFLKSIKIPGADTEAKSARIMLSTLTASVTKGQVLKELEKDILTVLLRKREADESEAAFSLRKKEDLDELRKKYISLDKLLKDHKDKVKDYSEEISRLQERFQNLIEQNYLRQQQMERNIIKSGYDRGSISSSDYNSTLQDRLSKLQSDYASKMSDIVAEKGRLLTMPMQTGEQQVKYLEQEIRIADIDKERLRVWQEMLEIQEEMYKLPSQTFGDALNKQLLQAKKTLDSIYDTLTTAFLDMGREFSKGIITEALFGTRDKELTSQIDDLRFQLIQMQVEKDNTLNTAQKVKLVEDQEVSLLARINDLERQRSQIILTLLTDVSKKMLDKLEDQAINALFSLAGGLFNSAQPSGFTTNDYYSTHAPRWRGNNATPLLPSSGSPSRNVVVQFTGNVYGGREFKEQVQTAIVEINRNIR